MIWYLRELLEIALVASFLLILLSAKYNVLKILVGLFNFQDPSGFFGCIKGDMKTLVICGAAKYDPPSNCPSWIELATLLLVCKVTLPAFLVTDKDPVTLSKLVPTEVPSWSVYPRDILKLESADPPEAETSYFWYTASSTLINSSQLPSTLPPASQAAAPANTLRA